MPNPTFFRFCLVAFLCVLSLGGCQRSTAPAPVEWGYKKAASYSSIPSRPSSKRNVSPAQKRALTVSKSLEPDRKSPPQKRDEIQIIEISGDQEKVISHKEIEKQKAKADSLEIVEITQEGKVEVIEGTPQPVRKPSHEEHDSPEIVEEKNKDVPGFPKPSKKPVVDDITPLSSGADLEPLPKSLSEEGVPMPLRKPKSPSVVPPSLAQPVKGDLKSTSSNKHGIDNSSAKESICKEPPQKSQEDSLFWEEEASVNHVDSPSLSQERGRPKEQGRSSSVSTSSALFSWPLKGKILKGFSKSGPQSRNDGLNIEGAIGDPVRAARQGQVVYVGNELHGFGHLILIKHDDEWMSAYAHLGQVHVQRGDVVRRSQVIATVGSSGSVAHPQLHFEVRRRSQPVDPKRFLE